MFLRHPGIARTEHPVVLAAQQLARGLLLKDRSHQKKRVDKSWSNNKTIGPPLANHIARGGFIFGLL